MLRRVSLKGFTLLEMLIAMALGLIVLGAAVQLFTNAVDGTFLVKQRSEMQQNGRAAVGFMSQDITLACSGMPKNAQHLPTAPGTKPI